MRFLVDGHDVPSDKDEFPNDEGKCSSDKDVKVQTVMKMRCLVMKMRFRQ